MTDISASVFDFIRNSWENRRTRKSASNLLVVSFVLGIVFYVLIHFNIVKVENDFFKHPFFPIEISFTLLLLLELFSLIFVLPTSVARSNSKQYELLSLIFLRSGFKEFSHIHSLSDWGLGTEPFVNMLAFGGGGLLIFFLVNLSYKLEKHIKLTPNEDEQSSFVKFKKTLSLLLLLSYFVVGFFDLWAILHTGTYNPSFETFYTILIFADIIVVLYSLRFSAEYIRIFRYSAFVLATIIIRISFSLEGYESVIVGVIGASYVLLVTFVYNYFLSREIKITSYK